jgi:hypothetical protein
MNDFVIHSCEQSLRFSTARSWEDLSDKLKMQFSFNVGVMALGLGLTKEEGYDALADVCLGNTEMKEFHQHVRDLLTRRSVVVNEDRIRRPF